MNYGCNLRPGGEKVTQTKRVKWYASVKTIKQVNVRISLVVRCASVKREVGICGNRNVNLRKNIPATYMKQGAFPQILMCIWQ